jgi:hypothetical protein
MSTKQTNPNAQKATKEEEKRQNKLKLQKQKE